jgi:hypothetical protein
MLRWGERGFIDQGGGGVDFTVISGGEGEGVKAFVRLVE